jgi:tetratricopeptide (TPR) repeat protein
VRFFAFLLVFSLSGLAVSNEVAVVVRAGGDVSKTNSLAETAPLVRRDTLVEGDRIETGPNGYVTLKFSDQSVIDLAENTVLAITRFRPEGESEKKKILLELLSGKLRNITGALAKEPDAFELQTAHASIGVRGTEFEVLVISSTETQVHWHAGNVLVKSLEFQGQILELSEAAQIATVTLGSPAKLTNELAADPMGVFDSNLLDLIDSIKAPPLAPLITAPIAAASLPLVLPLSADGPTPSGTSNGSDESEEPIEAFVNLVNNKSWSSARTLANELKDRFEGLPRFDLYHGLLLTAEENYDEAIFSFERVLVFTPDQHRARIELGRAYYLIGNYDRARDALNQVLEASPPADVKRNVNTLLARIDEASKRAQTQTNFGGTALIGWDSNANSGSRLDDTLDPNLLGLTELADASEPVESLYAQWSITTGLTKPTSQYSASQLTIDFTNKNYIEPSLGDTAALTALGNLVNQTERWKLQVPASTQFSWLDGATWQANVNAATSAQYNVWGPLWAGVKIGTEVAVALDDANTSNVKDLAGVLFDVSERGRVHTLSSLYLQTMVAGQDDGHIEWRGLANRYQLAWSLPWNIQGNLAVEHQWRRYKENDLFFTENDVTTDLKLRQDQVVTVNIQGSWAPTRWLQTQSSVYWEWVDSNINVYGRDRLTVSQAITVRF